MKKKYLKPDIAFIESVQDDIICTSPGTDPGGSGHDFSWGNGTGVTPGGSGADFDWGD